MTHYQVWSAIDAFAQAYGLTCSGLARRCGLDSTIFNKSKRFSKYHQPHWPSMSSISKIITEMNITPAEFFKFIIDAPAAPCDDKHC